MKTDSRPKNFAAIGVGGYIAPRHLKAIHDTGNCLLAAVDVNDSVGILDRHSFDVEFFTEIERFDRHLEKLRFGPEESKIDYVSVMSPNYLHDAHCRLALRVDAHAICEKPLVINPWNLDYLASLEEETGKRIYTVLQLRYHAALLKIQEELMSGANCQQHDVEITYVTPRGPWYDVSWKGNYEKSGGVVVNIGIHLFDMLEWLFGPAGDLRIYRSTRGSCSGFTEFEKARVKWFLSVDHNDLKLIPNAQGASRSVRIDGEEVDFSVGFTDLHTRVYEEILAGNGFGIEEARPSIELTSRIRNAEIVPVDSMAHRFMKDG
ncbi:MAG: Gfo/Idh/MocA family oxidoreductase [Anaerolineales bacterium]|nr:Gfo/Idh/MocA family oxidoreductase [Anaerolineales bacterium]